jgi:hypothetical protein
MIRRAHVCLAVYTIEAACRPKRTVGFRAADTAPPGAELVILRVSDVAIKSTIDGLCLHRQLSSSIAKDHLQDVMWMVMGDLNADCLE